MKRYNKLLTLAAIPVITLAASCNKNTSKVVNYDTASKFVAEHYDEHSLDYIKGNYALELKSFAINLEATVLDAIGIESKYAIGSDFSNLKITYNDLPTVIMDSSILKYIEVAYNTISEFSFEQLTRISIDKEYTIDNNCLTTKIGSDDSATDLLVLAGNGLNILAVAGELDMITEKLKQLGEIGSKIASFIDKLYGDSGYFISIAPTVTSDGKFYITLKTDDIGIVTNVNFTLVSNVKLNLDAISKVDPSMVYSVSLNGSINFNVDLSVSF